MKDLNHIYSSCPDYPACNFDFERVYYHYNKLWKYYVTFGMLWDIKDEY